jgi:nicotinate-nucleotide adenylyltransferase
MTESLRIGICGGTFDPFHNGHREPIVSAMQEVGWDRIVYMPAFRQPFKTAQASVSSWHRFAMAVMATAGDDWSEVSTWELERERISYTVETLEALAGSYAGSRLDWIIGDDNLPALMLWRDIDRILELANFVVLRRGSAPLPEPLAERVATPADAPRAGGVVFVDNPAVAVSSSEIRLRVRSRQPIGELVAPAVARHIEKYRLYDEEKS